MARGKIQMKRIVNPVHRQVTFCKRRAGLLKKAKELSVLCDAQIGLFIFSTQGKLFELATNGNMQEIIERYLKCTRGSLPDKTSEVPSSDTKEEINMLKMEIEILQKGLRYMFGGGAGIMSLDELNLIEKHLELWICQIRSTKMNLMFQEIQLLRNKEDILKATNNYLLEKVEENFRMVNFTPESTSITCPLTIDDDFFQF